MLPGTIIENADKDIGVVMEHDMVRIMTTCERVAFKLFGKLPKWYPNTRKHPQSR